MYWNIENLVQEYWCEFTFLRCRRRLYVRGAHWVSIVIFVVFVVFGYCVVLCGHEVGGSGCRPGFAAVHVRVDGKIVVGLQARQGRSALASAERARKKKKGQYILFSSRSVEERGRTVSNGKTCEQKNE